MRTLLYMTLFLLLGCNSQNAKDGLTDLKITWEVVSNLEKEGSHARFTFINESKKQIRGDNWIL